MKTTLNKILEHDPCSQNNVKGGWGLLLKNLGKTEADDEPLDLMAILESNGIKDAVWALRCFDYLDYCLFLADLAESVLHIYEKCNSSKAPREVIQAIRDYKAGVITEDELAAYASSAASSAAYAASQIEIKWHEMEALFIKHFGGENK